MLRVISVLATLAAAFPTADPLVLEALAVELQAARIATITVFRLVRTGQHLVVQSADLGLWPVRLPGVSDDIFAR